MVAEAYRIKLAHLFDPYIATHNPNITPLPHQIKAVYQDMMDKQPLRYILADDPGAGKTVMAGLFIKELMIRSDVKRCLIVVPGSLNGQWREELEEKFQLNFEYLELESQDPFKKDLLICRMDRVARNKELVNMLKASKKWDLVIVDEAHKMSANHYGQELKKTKRYRLGEILSACTRHFLLMTATPHNGKEESFSLFLSLLDYERFFPHKNIRFKDNDYSDVMRKMIKEGLLDFQGKKIFPKRDSSTLKYNLSDEEMDLYNKVTEYVRNEMNKADRVGGSRKNTVGFALTILQRRLASSPAAIFSSLERRIEKLKNKLKDQQSLSHSSEELSKKIEDSDEDDRSEKENKEIEEKAHQETASNSRTELETEISILKQLAKESKSLLDSGQDVKCNRLFDYLENRNNKEQKMVIFTENKDTLEYLEKKLIKSFGSQSVVCIYGSILRRERLDRLRRFKNNKETFILLGTDAIGEGVNLQFANLVLNYDIPWNPNRIEQRFGRVHRIGQKKMCHLFNFVADGTREGLVFDRLLEKIDRIKQDLGNDKIYDILGEVFSEKSLTKIIMKSVLKEQILESKEDANKSIEKKLNTEDILKILKDNSLVKGEPMRQAEALEVKQEMDRARTKKLQPYFVSAFFEEAVKFFEGKISRIKGQNELLNIQKTPEEIIQQAHSTGDSISERYDKVSFDIKKDLDESEINFIQLGHPLIDSTVELVLKEQEKVLKEGATFIDPNDFGDQLKVMMMLKHTVKQSTSNKPLSQKIMFVNIYKNKEPSINTDAPYIDFKPIDKKDKRLFDLIKQIKKDKWIKNIDKIAYEGALQEADKHYEQVKERQHKYLDKVIKVIKQRLSDVENFFSTQLSKEKDPLKQNKLKEAQKEIEERKKKRLEDLNHEKYIEHSSPIIIGRALIIPQGYIQKNRVKNKKIYSNLIKNKKRIEELSMEFVLNYETRENHQPKDVSRENHGWDIESFDKNNDLHLIKVKGIADDEKKITITRNEILKVLNYEHFTMFVVKVKDDKIKSVYFLNNSSLRSLLKDPGIADSPKPLNMKKVIELAERIH